MDVPSELNMPATGGLQLEKILYEISNLRHFFKISKIL